ncbi:MAG: methyltransferase, partial [Pseudomonadota bacterium]
LDSANLSAGTGLTAVRTAQLCDAACALGLMARRKGRYRIARKGAALTGVPGLEGMIAHHAVLYRDMADPLAVMRGEETELARFWPYVFGAGAATDPATARRYSDLMAETQTLVAEETLRLVDLSDAREVMDVGGGTGAFLVALGHKQSGPRLHLFDLPAVTPAAADRFAAAGLDDRVSITPGSFRDRPLPLGADAITLVRVLYDHSDDTVLALLRAAHDALPSGGRLVVSEPMTGGASPNRSGDVYFRFYCMAMGSGTARSADQIGHLLRQVGFDGIRHPASSRPFVTGMVTAIKP